MWPILARFITRTLHHLGVVQLLVTEVYVQSLSPVFGCRIERHAFQNSVAHGRVGMWRHAVSSDPTQRITNRIKRLPERLHLIGKAVDRFIKPLDRIDRLIRGCRV